MTLAESCNFLAVNTGKHFFGVHQTPNHTFPYGHGTAPCGDVKYFAKI